MTGKFIYDTLNVDDVGDFKHKKWVLKMINWDDIKLSDDFLFARVMKNEHICKQLLECILKVEIERLEFLETQKSIDLKKDARSIRLDIYVKDEKETVYNIEMQVANTANLPKRSRYYQSMIDINSIGKGRNFEELNQSFIIFICTFDIADKNRYMYTYESICVEEKDLKLEDGSTRIFLNTKGTVGEIDSNLKAVLHCINGIIEKNEFVEEILKEIEFVKNDKKWRIGYMNLYMRDQERLKQGRLEGRLEAKIEYAYKLILEGLPEDVVKKILELTEEEYKLVMKDSNSTPTI